MTNPAPSENAEPLGARIKRLRQVRGISQDRLAIEARVDQSGLSKFERGKARNLSKVPLTRIAAVLGLSYEQLIRDTDFHR